MFVSAAPVVFVSLWSTGFVIARYGTRDAGPLTFLFLRMVAASVILWAIATFSNAPRLTPHDIRWAAVSGTGMHAVYLGGVFVASDLGMPSGLSALIAGLHPVVTSILAVVLLGELLLRRQWIGVCLGILGVGVVVIERMRSTEAVVATSALIAMAVSVIGMSAGTLVQRARGTAMPLLRGTAVQYAASAGILGIGAFAVEGFDVEFTTRMVLSLVWSIIILSLAAILIMLWLLQRHAAAEVSSLFFLTPALSTIEGSILFGERLGVLAVIGLGIALVGVALATRARTPAVLPAAES